jgi:hypothetical protein
VLVVKPLPPRLKHGRAPEITDDFSRIVARHHALGGPPRRIAADRPGTASGVEKNLERKQ